MNEHDKAEHAKMLLGNPLLKEALDDMRLEALEHLSEADIEVSSEILRWQECAKAPNELRERLQRYIDALPSEE